MISQGDLNRGVSLCKCQVFPPSILKAAYASHLNNHMDFVDTHYVDVSAFKKGPDGGLCKRILLDSSLPTPLGSLGGLHN